MVRLAHFRIAGVGLELHAFERIGDRFWIVGLALVGRGGQHLDHRADLMEVQLDAVFLLEFVGELFRLVVFDVGIPDTHDFQVINAIFLDRSRRTESGSIDGVDRHAHVGVFQRFHQQGKIVTPVAGQDCIGAGSLDLGCIA